MSKIRYTLIDQTFDLFLGLLYHVLTPYILICASGAIIIFGESWWRFVVVVVCVIAAAWSWFIFFLLTNNDDLNDPPYDPLDGCDQYRDR